MLIMTAPITKTKGHRMTNEKNECFEIKKIREEIARLEGVKNPNLHERLKLGFLRQELAVATVTYIDNPNVAGPEKEPPFNGVLKEMDFTGCHPFIAEQLKKGMMVLCETKYDQNQFVCAYTPLHGKYFYIDSKTGFTVSTKEVTPVTFTPPVTRIKPLHE